MVCSAPSCPIAGLWRLAPCSLRPRWPQVLSVYFGSIASYLPRMYTHLASVVLFVIFGAKMLWVRARALCVDLPVETILPLSTAALHPFPSPRCAACDVRCARRRAITCRPTRGKKSLRRYNVNSYLCAATLRITCYTRIAAVSRPIRLAAEP